MRLVLAVLPLLLSVASKPTQKSETAQMLLTRSRRLLIDRGTQRVQNTAKSVADEEAGGDKDGVDDAGDDDSLD